jgi:large subunit ribosomal protein L5
VIVSVGVGKNMRDPKDIAIARNTLLRITGQRPVETKAKKSISGFKVRQGMVVGLVVTLRGRRMNDFLEKLIRVALPRVRDFRGLDTASVDRIGHCTLGIREHIAFPEIRSDEIEKIHGPATMLAVWTAARLPSPVFDLPHLFPRIGE